jgi:hypothetical protein
MIQQQHRAVIARKRFIDLGTPALHLDATSFSQSDDTNVTTWSDISGNSRHALHTGAGGEIAPSFRTNIQNGLSAIEWKGASACGMRIATQNLGPGGWGLGSQITIYVAFKRTVINNGPFFFWDSSGALTNALFASAWVTASSQSYLQIGSTAGQTLIPTAGNAHTTAWQIWCFTLNGTAQSVRNANDSVLGSNTSGDADGIVSAGTATFFLGGFISGVWTADLSWRGHIGEMKVFPIFHSTAQRTSQLSLLRTKWGI